jgi:hypothetical protein
LGILDEVLEEVNFTPEDVEEYLEKFTTVSALDPGKFFVSQNQETAPKQVRVETPAPAANTPKQPVPHTLTAPPVPPKAIQNEGQGREPRPTIAGNFQKRKKIKESLTINQKFMFTKVLFHGDFELFTRAVDRLDQLDNLSSALRYIEDEHASTWDRDSEEFHEFMELVENRFA